ncbi:MULTISPECIES: hypothetical protein [unclassified Caulobacter]|uniref:hypothetical protein n=1 Tax=unclassified Caulobacter TaxID=2648921 RepID=UPI0004A777D2|nr:hypothetical protein [Caulobacter sp. UNC358MFTsu5.1]
MFKITMIAGGISAAAGPEAAQDIEQHFREERTWHQQVTCSFNDGVLTLVAVNDYDKEGLALSDEFSDCLSAFIHLGEISDDGVFKVVSVEIV